MFHFGLQGNVFLQVAQTPLLGASEVGSKEGCVPNLYKDISQAVYNETWNQIPDLLRSIVQGYVLHANTTALLEHPS